MGERHCADSGSAAATNSDGSRGDKRGHRHEHGGGDRLPESHGDQWPAEIVVFQLLADPERRRRMGEAGRARMEREFTVEKHVAGMLNLYERATAAQV